MSSGTTFVVHILNLPPGVRWRQVKEQLLLASGIPEEAILNIKVLPGSCTVSLTSPDLAQIVAEELDGARYLGLILVARTEQQLNHHSGAPLYPFYNPSQSPYLITPSLPGGGPPTAVQIPGSYPSMGPPEFFPLFPMPMMPPMPPSAGQAQGLDRGAHGFKIPTAFLPPPAATNNAINTVFTSPSVVSPRVLKSLRQYPYQNITDPVDRKKLFIGNIPYSTQWTSLKDLLRSAGEIFRVEIPTDHDGSSKGFAIANFSNEESAARAIEMFNGFNFEGRPLTVRYDRFPTGQNKRQENATRNDENVEQSENGDQSPSPFGKQLDAVVKKFHADHSDSPNSSNNNNKVSSPPSDEDDKRFENEARSLIESLNINM